LNAVDAALQIGEPAGALITTEECGAVGAGWRLYDAPAGAMDDGGRSARTFSTRHEQRPIPAPSEELTDSHQEQPRGDKSLAAAPIVNEDNQPEAADRTGESAGHTDNVNELTPANQQRDEVTARCASDIAGAVVVNLAYAEI
jgi:hypothetical protein